MIEITKKEYYNLKRRDAKLELLENGGVDNWTYYSDSLNPDDEDGYDEICEQLEKNLLGEN